MDGARTAQVNRAVGAQVRLSRRARKWDRSALRHQLDDMASVQAIAAWERGSRAVTTARLFQLAEALGESPSSLIAAAERSLAGQYHHADDSLEVSLDALAGQLVPELGPARRWAVAILRHERGGGTRTSVLTPAAVAVLAELTQLSVGTLVRHLRTVSAEQGHRHGDEVDRDANT